MNDLTVTPHGLLHWLVTPQTERARDWMARDVIHTSDTRHRNGILVEAEHIDGVVRGAMIEGLRIATN